MTSRSAPSSRPAASPLAAPSGPSLLRARPRRATALAVFLGSHAVVAGGLVAWSLGTARIPPPLYFVILDLIVIACAGCAAFGTWHRSAWAGAAFASYVAALVAVGWAHVLAADPDASSRPGSVAGIGWPLLATGVSFLLAVWVARDLGRLSRSRLRAPDESSRDATPGGLSS